MGVLPEFQRPSFVRTTGIQVTRDLIQYAVAQCQTVGSRSVRAQVSIHNPTAQMLYKRFGWKLAPENALGQKSEAEGGEMTSST